MSGWWVSGLAASQEELLESGQPSFASESTRVSGQGRKERKKKTWRSIVCDIDRIGQIDCLPRPRRITNRWRAASHSGCCW